MMRDDKLIELLKFYASDLDDNDIDCVKQLPADLYQHRFPGGVPRISTLRHAAWMAEQAIGFIKEAQTLEANAPDAHSPFSAFQCGGPTMRDARSKREKAHRWLGFIQGVLWMTGVFTLDELKEHSRQCSDEPEKAETK
jgi:hypothetical protein